MKYAVATMHDIGYQKLGDITNPNKQEYCERHGYGFHLHTGFQMYYKIGFEKIQFTLDIFKNNPEYEWLLFAEADTMITNLTIRLENIVDNNYHFIIAKDVTDINAGVFLARNTSEGKSYLQMIHNAKETCHHQACEQFVIINTYKSYPNIVKTVHQRLFNSFEYSLYTQHRYDDFTLDKTGQYGSWKRGDFIIHWPGRTLDQRMQSAKQIEPLIIR